MPRTLLDVVCILAGATLIASSARAGAFDEYDVPYPPASRYAAPPHYPPPTSYGPPRYYAQPPAPYYAPQSYGYQPPPVADYAPPGPAWLPPRPSNCGEYRYWNGQYCADARYEPPYVGPRW
jgi:hypothetical protein